MPRQRTACFTCAAIKTACSRDQPCRRCERLSLTCSYVARWDRKRAEPSASHDQVHHRASHRRSRHGCVNCLQRRRKCDEEYPMCQECRRLGLSDCRPRTRSFSSIESSIIQGNSIAKSPFSDSLVVSSNFRSTQGHINPLDFNVSEYLGHIALQPEVSLTGITRRGHLNESSALKSRSVSCGDTKTEQPTSSGVYLGGRIYIPAAITATFGATEHHLLHHYTQYVSRALVVINCDDENPFLSEILPVAMDMKSVRHAMFALSACHLCKVYPKFEDTLIRQHSLALHFLTQSLQLEGSTDTSLLASLLLCLLWICHGKSSKWILHLYGVKALIDSHPHKVLPARLSKFTLDLYDLICCKARIACCQAPVARDEFSLSFTNRVQSHDTIHPLFGLGKNMYQALDAINSLATKKATTGTTAQDDAMLAAKAQQIESFLHGWSVPMPIQCQDRQLVHDNTMAAEALRWAIIIRFHQVMGWEFSNETNQKSAMENILRSVSQIQPSSPANGQILLPLFIAGLSTARKTERLQIGYRMSLLENTVGMGNITSAHQFLDLVWGHSRKEIKWEAFLQKEHPYVILF
ncbi:fungal-specific transcription factor domain-containing protein [Aspergillus cavernicola]|uniref:Fungal-specific transcription factor domain-containing protein n=1 Tax=Aspergillus cavernicola TaxID=176166 RepID=A0ABR4IPE5_9EURO